MPAMLLWSTVVAQWLDRLTAEPEDTGAIPATAGETQGTSMYCAMSMRVKEP